MLKVNGISRSATSTLPSLDLEKWIGYPDSANNDDDSMNYVTILLLLTLSLSCRQAPSPPEQTLPLERFQSVYVALLEEGERYKRLPPDSSRHFSADSIFHASNTSEREFRSTVASYRADPKNWQLFYEAASKRLDEKQKTHGTK
jgi:hypothetical protein